MQTRTLCVFPSTTRCTFFAPLPHISSDTQASTNRTRRPCNALQHWAAREREGTEDNWHSWCVFDIYSTDSFYLLDVLYVEAQAQALQRAARSLGEEITRYVMFFPPYSIPCPFLHYFITHCYFTTRIRCARTHSTTPSTCTLAVACISWISLDNMPTPETTRVTERRPLNPNTASTTHTMR